jgi:Protein tyrosine and serine/threonine kinase
MVSNRRPQLPADVAALSPVLNQLMEDCWHKDAEQRPTFKEIVQRLEKHLPRDPRGAPPLPVDLQVLKYYYSCSTTTQTAAAAVVAAMY